VLDHTATAWLRRLLTWLERFEDRFSRQSQRGALRRYVTGLLSDSPRKSMEAMWARLSDPGTYQAFQHFITDAPWEAEALWKRLREVVPDRTGVLILDGTSFPKQGPASVGVGRQYCGALGKIANCQVAVTVALWTGTQAWLLGARLYLPEAWLTPAQRTRARIPATATVVPKWQLALTLLRQVRAARITVTAVVGDAEFGDNATLRRTLHRARLPYALGVSADCRLFLGTPAWQPPPPLIGKGRPRTRARLPPETVTVEARAWAAEQPLRQWRLVSWRNGTNPPWRARFCAVRVTPAHDWRERRRLASEVWLLCERDLGETPRTKYYLVDLPADAPLKALVQLAHQRWAIEQQYQELKDELGLDHFEGRTLPGWERHVVLTALAYSFLQIERRRRGQTHLTLPRVRAVVQEVLTAHFFMTQPHYLKWMLKLKDVELRN
jgi:SRSO17 transposase